MRRTSGQDTVIDRLTERTESCIEAVVPPGRIR